MDTTTETRHSVCSTCDGPISISIEPGQRWDAVAWEHPAAPADAHPAAPELRAAIDATCPDCRYPEVGYAFDREVFVCSRCQWTGTERPAA